MALYITFEAPLSGMSMNPARTVASALPAHVWTGVWIYFIAPPLGMLLAAEVYLLWRGQGSVLCCKLHHENDSRCIFRCRYHSCASVRVKGEECRVKGRCHDSMPLPPSPRGRSSSPLFLIPHPCKAAPTADEGSHDPTHRRPPISSGKHSSSASCASGRLARGCDSLASAVLWPVLDLVIRLWLAQVFFVSGVLKAANWDNA